MQHHKIHNLYYLCLLSDALLHHETIQAPTRDNDHTKNDFITRSFISDDLDNFTEISCYRPEPASQGLTA